MPRKVVDISLDQLQALSNPRRIEIHTSLRTDGPATARELASRLKVEELSLYYHLRLLTAKKLITAKSRAGTTKPETIYSVDARYLVKGIDLREKSNRDARCKNIDSLLRACSRENRIATEELRDEVDERSLIGRTPVRLSPAKFRQLRNRLKDLTKWIVENHDPSGEKYSVSVFALPIAEPTRKRK